MKLRKDVSDRGFVSIEFIDLYGEEGSIQKSSLATDDAIWIGVRDVKPKRMASKAGVINPETGEVSGWVDYPIPEDVLLSGRLHLNKEQVQALIPILQRFVETGDVDL